MLSHVARTLLFVLLASSGCGAGEYGFGPERLENPEPPLDTGFGAMAEYRIKNLDVWFVIDGSGSMNDDADFVSHGLARTFRELLDRTSAFSILVFTADPGNLHYVGPFGPNNTEQDLLQAPQNLPNTTGEFPFGATVRMFTEHGAEFAFPENDLLVIIVTDEEEQTAEISPNSFSGWIDSTKGDVAEADVISVAPINAGCGQIAERLIALAGIRENNVIDLCDFGWEEVLGEASFIDHWEDEWSD